MTVSIVQCIPQSSLEFSCNGWQLTQRLSTGQHVENKKLWSVHPRWPKYLWSWGGGGGAERVWESEVVDDSNQMVGFLDIMGSLHVWPHTSCDSVCRTCTSSSPTKITAIAGEVGIKSHCSLRNYRHLMAAGREKSGFLTDISRAL